MAQLLDMAVVALAEVEDLEQGIGQDLAGRDLPVELAVVGDDVDEVIEGLLPRLMFDGEADGFEKTVDAVLFFERIVIPLWPVDTDQQGRYAVLVPLDLVLVS